MSNIIDVDDVIELSNQVFAVNSKNLDSVEFHYDGRIIDVPVSEIEAWEFTGLNVMDFILNREWPDNPAYDNN